MFLYSLACYAVITYYIDLHTKIYTMLNYTYDTVELVDDKPVKTLYLGHSRDIAETVAVLACQKQRFVNDFAVLRVETGERVSRVNASVLRQFAARFDFL